MEDVYTIKVKTKPDPRNLYPSERQYSASTVCGLSWIHIFLSIISLILTLLTIFIPVNEKSEFNSTFNNATYENGSLKANYNIYLIMVASILVSFFGLTVGLTAVLASVRWYVDRYIKWLFVSSLITSSACLIAVFTTLTWIISNNLNGEVQNVFILKQSDILDQNVTHFIIYRNATVEHTNLITDKVLSINILITTLLELFVSILSVKISYKGIKRSYNIEKANCVQVITTIKGDGKINPNRKIKKLCLTQSNGFNMKNDSKGNNSEFHRERMMNFLNCSFEGDSNLDRTPSVQSEINSRHLTPDKRITMNWGDTPDHTVYNQNTLSFERIFNFNTDKKADNE